MRAVLADGELTVEQRIPWSSNGTYLVRVSGGAGTWHAVYKPRLAERPLWDFPTGTLCLREMATFVVSAALRWDLVPPTALRDGPFGPGSVQAFIPHDPEAHFLALAQPDPLTVQRLAVFDAVINNADRKSGHVLRDETGRLWAIDHGIAFHVEPKLRTVIWDYAGQPIPTGILDDLARLQVLLAESDESDGTDEAGGGRDTGSGDPARADDPGGGLRRELGSLLAVDELDALRARIRRLLRKRVFPGADPHRRMIPWPPV